MAGAHLDSVAAGPGMNDNGSGSSALIEIAEQMAKVHMKLPNKVRFALWAAEESDLVGSTFYVNSLGEDQLADLEMYLNFDMVGSPNYGLKTPEQAAKWGGTAGQALDPCYHAACDAIAYAVYLYASGGEVINQG